MTMAGVIPFRHEEAKARTAFIGMVIFLGSWAMMFAALFFAYGVVRANSPVWPPPGFVPLPKLLPAFNTLVLLASSGTLQLGLRRVREGHSPELRWWLLATLALGLLFV